MIIDFGPTPRGDGEVRELTDADVQRMHPMPEVLPTYLQRIIGQRGKQAAPTKVKTSTRFSREVMEHPKEEGDGWQSRIDQALKKKH